MEKFKLSDLVGAGKVSVAQKVALYMESYARQSVFEGTSGEIPDGYQNFVVNGVAAEGDVLKIRVTVF